MTIELGKLVDSDISYGRKDAIHVAVISAVAMEILQPGQVVGMEGVVADSSAPACGIVDPFLTESVEPGHQFWVVMYPGTVQNLRHEWDHPLIEEKEDEDEWDMDDGCRGC